MLSMTSLGEWLKMTGLLPLAFIIYGDKRNVKTGSIEAFPYFDHVMNIVNCNAFCTKFAVIAIRQKVFIEFRMTDENGKNILRIPTENLQPEGKVVQKIFQRFYPKSCLIER